MKTTDLDSQIENIAKARLDRRKFFRQAGLFGFGALASGAILSGTKGHRAAEWFPGHGHDG